MNRSMRRVVPALAAALLGAGMLTAIAAPAAASRVIHVVGSNPGDATGCGATSFACASIQYAVDNAVAGDTVEADAPDGSTWTYSESVRIDKAITLTSGPGVTLTGVVTVADAGAGATTTVTGLSFARGGGIVVDTDTGSAVVSGNSFNDVAGPAIALDNSGTDPMPVTVTGNTGTVAAPGATVTESGPVAVSAPTLNTISPDPKPGLTAAAGPVKIVPGATPRQIGSADAPAEGSPLSSAQYDLTVTSADAIDATDLALDYADGSGTHSVAATGNTSNGSAVLASVTYPADPDDLTFDLAGTPGGATGTLHVAIALDEYAGQTLVNQIATTAVTVDDVADPGPSYAGNTIYLHANGSPTAVDISATDTDADPLTYTVVDPPSSGTLSGTAPHLTYTPTDTVAADSFTYQVSDGFVTGATATVTLLPNHPPSAPDGSETVHNVGSTTFSLGPASDVADGGQPLTYAITTPPSHGGTASVSGTQVTYTSSGTPGTDSLGYTVSDGVDSASGTIAITVNQAPGVTSFNTTVKHAGATTITLGPATEPDGTTITYTVTTQPGHGGTLAAVGNQVSYTPTTGYTGPDTFGFTAGDGVDTVTATVGVTVNKPPVVADQSPPPVHHSGPTTLTITPAVDGDNQTLVYTVKTGPAHGTLGTFTGNQVAYTPTAGYTGPDSFVVTASDGLESVDAVVHVTVNALPDVHNVSWRVHNTGPTTITLGPVADDDGQALTYTIGSQATAHGTLATPSGNTLTYTPNSPYTGTDSFDVTATDGIDPVTVTVTITVNKPPVVPRNTTVRVSRTASTTITLGETKDAEGQPVQYLPLVDSGPAHGVLGVIAGNHVTYTPDPAAPDQDSFTVMATDQTDSVPETVTVEINTVPVAKQRSITTAFGHPVAITLGPTTDPDGDHVAYHPTTKPAHGNLKTAQNTVTYTPAAGFAGSVSFQYTASDAFDTSKPATVHISVSRAATSLSATVSPSRPTSAQHPTLTVRVTSAGNPNTGTVTVGSQKAAVRSGVATLTLPQYAGGAHNVTATFSGSGTTRPATRSVPFTVTKVASSLTASTNPTQITTRTTGAVLTVVIHAGPYHPASGRLSIDDYTNGKAYHLGDVTPRSGTARFTLPRLGVGQHNLTMSYAGNSYVSSGSTSLTERVGT